MPGSVYTVVAITIERFTTLRGENDKVIINLGTRELMCNFFFFQSLFKGRTMIVFIVAFSILYNLVKFFELTTEIKV